MGFLITFVVGWIVGVLADTFLKQPLEKGLRNTARRLRSYWRPVTLRLSDDETIVLGNADTHVLLIDGSGDSVYDLSHIDLIKDPEAIEPDADMAGHINALEEEEQTKRHQGIPGWKWNGAFAHIDRFVTERTPDAETLRLRIHIRRAQYFHHLLTAGRVHDDFKANGFESEVRKAIIGDFSDWKTRVPPGLVAGLPVNLAVVTSDRQFVFSRRSSEVAVGAGGIASAVNENLHPDHDDIGEAYSIRNLIGRALKQEMGWNDAEHESPAAIQVMAFGVHLGTTHYGLFGYVELPLNFARLAQLFSVRAKDRPEIGQLIPVPLKLRELCEFIHTNELYNTEGVIVLLTAIHHGGWSVNDLNREFDRIQNLRHDDTSRRLTNRSMGRKA